MNAVALLYTQTNSEHHFTSLPPMPKQKTPLNYLQKLHNSSYFTVAHKEAKSTINNFSSHCDSAF